MKLLKILLELIEGRVIRLDSKKSECTSYSARHCMEFYFYVTRICCVGG